MRKFAVASLVRLMAALSGFCLMATVVASHAQNLPASPFAATRSALGTISDDELLARAGKLYYSATRAGLDSFVCEVHPDWHAMFVSANKSQTIGEDDPSIVLLKTVKVILHGRLKGGSTVDWTPAAKPAAPIAADSARMLENMRGGTNQTLQGFMQFWAPFVDGSTIPGNAQGLQITRTEDGHRIHADLSGTSLTESLDGSLILRRFDVVAGGMTAHFAPSFKPTDKGLLVDAFHAQIEPPGVQPGQAQVMNVEIEYQTVSSFPIPARINMEVVNVGNFNFVLDGCSVNQPENPKAKTAAPG